LFYGKLSFWKGDFGDVTKWWCHWKFFLRLQFHRHPSARIKPLRDKNADKRFGLTLDATVVLYKGLSKGEGRS